MATLTKTVTSRLMRLLMVICLALLPLYSCTHLYGRHTSGKVVEIGSNTPIADAFVVAKWDGDLFAIVETRYICVHVEVTQSDEKGRYSTPFWRASPEIEPKSLVQWQTSLSVPYAYKPGYEWVESKYGKIYLKPSTKTPHERLEWLWWQFMEGSCDAAGKSQRALFPFYKALYEEAKNLASDSNEDKKTLYLMRSITAEALFSEEHYQDMAISERLISDYLKDHLQ